MRHLNWREILEAVEDGESPPHLGTCPTCAARWSRAREMLLALAPEGEQPRDLEPLVRRVLQGAGDPRPRLAPRLRWALAAGIFLCAVGPLAFWRYHQLDLDRQYAAILADDLVSDPSGLDNLLPRWSFADLDPLSDDLTLFYEEKGE